MADVNAGFAGAKIEGQGGPECRLQEQKSTPHLRRI